MSIWTRIWGGLTATLLAAIVLATPVRAADPLPMTCETPEGEPAEWCFFLNPDEYKTNPNLDWHYNGGRYPVIGYSWTEFDDVFIRNTCGFGALHGGYVTRNGEMVQDCTQNPGLLSYFFGLTET